MSVSNLNFLVIGITFVLFVLALFTKGITHDFFLEAGIFLVSVKLIMANYSEMVVLRRLEGKIDAFLRQTGKE